MIIAVVITMVVTMVFIVIIIVIDTVVITMAVTMVIIVIIIVIDTVVVTMMTGCQHAWTGNSSRGSVVQALVLRKTCCQPYLSAHNDLHNEPSCQYHSINYIYVVMIAPAASFCPD